MKGSKHYEGLMPSQEETDQIGATGQPFAETIYNQNYPDGSPNFREQTQGAMPQTHGFPINPMEHLAAQLEAFEREEREEEERWEGVGRKPKTEEELAAEKKEAKRRDKLDIDPNDVLFEQEIPDQVPMSTKELRAPLTSEQIRERRRQAKSRGGSSKLGGMASGMIPEVHVLVIGGSDYQQTNYDAEGNEYTEGYDDTEHLERYQDILQDIFEGKAMLLLEKIEPIQRTSKFKIFLKIARYVD